MSEALESISPRPVGPLTPLAPAAGPDGVGGGDAAGRGVPLPRQAGRVGTTDKRAARLVCRACRIWRTA